MSGYDGILTQILAFEDGELDYDDELAFFGQLIATGLAWSLQGSYGRTAADLIEQGLISTEGEVLA